MSLSHSRNSDGELSMWVTPTTCPCSTCVEYCKEKGLSRQDEIPTPPVAPVLVRQNAVITGYDLLDSEMDKLSLTGMITRWRKRISELEDAFGKDTTSKVGKEINSLLSRIVQAQNLIDLIQAFHP